MNITDNKIANYPVKLDNPRAWRTYIGGKLLDKLHGKKEAKDSNFPEEWIMSLTSARNAGREEFLDEGLSHVGDQTLIEYLEQDPAGCLGESCFADRGLQTGMLVKLIDSQERLTVQVHPDKEMALKLFDSQYGKTECWHIIDTRSDMEEAACIYIGFKPGITRENWKRLFDIQDIEGMLSCLHKFEVKKGETILIEGGVPHAIGAGCLLVEIQEPTDYTIRIEKTTPSGLVIKDEMCHQGLGFDKMFDCFHYEGLEREVVKKRWWIKPGKIDNQTRQLIGSPDCELFSMNEIKTDKSVTLKDQDCFYGLYILEGEGALSWKNDKSEIKFAQQYFVPANVKNLSLTASEGHSLRVLQFFGPQVRG